MKSSSMHTALIGGATPASLAADITWTIARLGFGLLMAFGHGIHKVPPGEQFVEGVGDLGFPVPVIFAWMAAISEFFGGLLLAVGLLTRPAAFLIVGTMFVAAFIRHWEDPVFGPGASKEMALLYLCAAVAFLGAGGGRFSIDMALRTWLGGK